MKKTQTISKNSGGFFMKKISKFLFLWSVGGCIYYNFELIFRGFSHWTMFGLGGICFLFIYIQGYLLKWSDSLVIQVLRCVIFVTAMEFISGIVLNKWLDLGIWDYGRMPFQLYGQICLPFVIIFSGLCAIGIILSGYIGYWFYGEEKPHYHVL